MNKSKQLGDEFVLVIPKAKKLTDRSSNTGTGFNLWMLDKCCQMTLDPQSNDNARGFLHDGSLESIEIV
jgi:hypothetical protein